MASDEYTQPPAYGTIPPSIYGADYAQLMQQGLPLAVVHSMLTQPSLGEGETPPHLWSIHHPYAGMREEDKGAAGVPRDRQTFDAVQAAPAFNWLPREEQSRAGPTSNLLLLPNGQYVPWRSDLNPADALRWYQQQGAPSSFYWNPHNRPSDNALTPSPSQSSNSLVPFSGPATQSTIGPQNSFIIDHPSGMFLYDHIAGGYRTLEPMPEGFDPYAPLAGGGQ